VQDLVDAAVRMNAEDIEASGARLVVEVADLPALPLDKHRTMVVLVNLIKNACQATQRSPQRDPCVTLRADIEDGKLRIVVSDSGEGIPAENLPRIFSHGFTTRAGGHGFGLHSCAVAAVEMGGRLRASSDGAGKGASFMLEIPVGTAVEQEPQNS
jgi:signal transduction histidine kinase